MIIIRADGGNGIGMGHLARTSVLADELLKYEEVIYVSSRIYKEGIEFLHQKGYRVIETDNVVSTLLSMQAECIITDNYGIDEIYINEVRKHFNVVVYIDDNALMPYKADVIVNQNYKAEQINYKVNKECKMLLGTEYLIVREEFRKLNPIIIHKKIKKVLVTVGGSDKWNYTDRLLAELIYQLPFEFHVVIGPAFPYQEELIEKYSENGNVIFEVMPCMSEVASKCDLAISSSGSTLYELGLIGIPTIGIIVADNQQGVAERMHMDGLIRCVGDIQELSGEALREEVLNLVNIPRRRIDMQIKNSKKLNANGVQVIARNIIKLIDTKSAIKV